MREGSPSVVVPHRVKLTQRLLVGAHGADVDGLVGLKNQRLMGLGKQLAAVALSAVYDVTGLLCLDEVGVFPVDAANQRQVCGWLALKVGQLG